MKEVKTDLQFGQEVLYDLKEVLENFPKYFGISFQDAKVYLTKYQIPSERTIKIYIQDNIDKMQERKNNPNISIEEIIEARLRDYKYFSKTLDILSNKGQELLELIFYIAHYKNELQNQQMEEKIAEMGIFYYSTLSLGYILNAFRNLILEFNENLIKINKLDTYNQQTIDSFTFKYASEDLYPSRELILDDSKKYDNTSIKLPYNKIHYPFTRKKRKVCSRS